VQLHWSLEMTDAIRFEVKDTVAELCLCAPERRNAIGSREIALVKAAIESIPDACRLFVIRSEGSVFCAGANLKEITDGTMEGDDFQSMTNAIASLTIPSLAIVEGDVFGGGAELLFSCDFRLGVTGKDLKIPAASIGLCYPVEGIQRMTRRLGGTLVRKLLLTTEAVSFEELAQHNAFDWLVPSTEIKAESDALIARLTGLAPLSMASMLAIIKSVEEDRFDRAAAQRLADSCSESEDLSEGLLAIREKRAPKFMGR
jgi:enoyl-CoA hydratase/carnithine racemase